MTCKICGGECVYTDDEYVCTICGNGFILSPANKNINCRIIEVKQEE